jgi:hypothetical protein
MNDDKAPFFFEYFWITWILMSVNVDLYPFKMIAIRSCRGTTSLTSAWPASSSGYGSCPCEWQAPAEMDKLGGFKL